MPAQKLPRASNSANPWSPLGQTAFLGLWTASLLSNIGTWMNNVAAAWLMEKLTHSPLWVALVPAAAGLPVFFFGLLAGALADRLDRRRYLLVTQLGQLLVALAMTVGNLQNPVTLLILLAALGTGSALATPAWQATTPTLVPPEQLPQAIALNGISVNLSRALGPALGGLVLAGYGATPVFAINSLSFAWVLLTVWRMKSPQRHTSRTDLRAALTAGPRYVAQTPVQASIMLRTGLTTLVAAAQGALLPVYSVQILHQGPSGLGLLYGCVGFGAICGAQLLPRLRRLGWDVAAALSSLLFALHLWLLAQTPQAACLILFGGGVGWIGMVSTFSTAAQTAAPRWIQARILSIFAIVFQGGLALGSAFWGWFSLHWGLPQALQAAGLALALSQLLVPLLKIGEIRNVQPAQAYPELADHHAAQRGPVRVELGYRVPDEQRQSFLQQARALERLRRRDGAYHWSLDESTREPGLFRELFWVRTWAEHEDQHAHAQEGDLDILKPVQDYREGPAEHYLPPVP